MTCLYCTHVHGTLSRPIHDDRVALNGCMLLQRRPTDTHSNFISIDCDLCKIFLFVVQFVLNLFLCCTICAKFLRLLHNLCLISFFDLHICIVFGFFLQYITDGYAMHLDDLHLQTHTTPANANFQLRKQTFGLPPTRKHRSKATSGTDISLGSTQHSSPVAQREGSIGYRTFSKKLPMFRSRRTSTKTPHDQQTDLHHCLSATSLSSFRDRSNSDPSVAAASAAAKAIEKKRKLTPPASYSSDYAPVQNTCASPHSNLLSAPADVNRSLSVPAMNSPEEPDARQSHRMKRRSMDVRHLPARSTDV